MVSPKQLTLLAAAGVAASLFLAQPARALTAIAQPYLVSSWEGVSTLCSLLDTAGGMSIAMDGVITVPSPRYGPSEKTAAIWLPY